MDLTAGTRATAATGAVILAGGTLALLHGIIRHDLARTLGGTCAFLTALTLIALALIRKWTTDTGEERRVLAATQREAQARKDTYLAAQAALENEQGRLNRDMAAARASLAAQLQAEREAMEAAFEERRAQLISETTEAVVQMIRGGKLSPTPQAQPKVIQLRDHQQRRPERERTREHGGVAP
jgi:hypothetical protein